MTRTARENCRLGRQQELTRTGHENAKQFYQQAIGNATDYLPAYAEFSYVYLREYQNAWGEDRSRSLAQARALADQAVQMGDDPTNDIPNDSRCRWYSAMIYWNEGDFARSFEEFEAARTLISDPDRIVKDNADLDADMAEAMIYFGEPDRAITLIRDAMVRYPDFPYWYWWNLGRAYYMAGRYREAIDAITEIEAADKIVPTPNDVHLITAASEAQLGNIASAKQIMAEFSEAEPDWSIAKSAEYHYGRESDRQHWTDGLRKAGLKER